MLEVHGTANIFFFHNSTDTVFFLTEIIRKETVSAFVLWPVQVGLCRPVAVKVPVVCIHSVLCWGVDSPSWTADSVAVHYWTPQMLLAPAHCCPDGSGYHTHSAAARLAHEVTDWTEQRQCWFSCFKHAFMREVFLRMQHLKSNYSLYGQSKYRRNKCIQG